MARRKRQDLEQTEAKAQELVRQLKAVRAEIAEKKKAARLERANLVLERLERWGLAEAVLSLDETQCQQVAALDGTQRIEVLMRLCASGQGPERLAGESRQAESETAATAAAEDTDRGSQQSLGGLFGR